MFKLVFENLKVGTKVTPCLGTVADFNSGTCAMDLASSGGPGSQFLTIVDTAALTGKILFVKRAIGNLAMSRFSLTVE